MTEIYARLFDVALEELADSISTVREQLAKELENPDHHAIDETAYFTDVLTPVLNIRNEYVITHGGDVLVEVASKTAGGEQL